MKNFIKNGSEVEKLEFKIIYTK